MYILVGLGNPGEEYENTRHNTGRLTVQAYCQANKFENFVEDGKTNSLRLEGKIGKNKITCLLPETFMNKSGSAVKKLVTSKKKAEKLIVFHDDLDLAIGRFKISFGKGSGGHKGVESVMRAVKTKDFWRVRIGICPITSKGKTKKLPRRSSGQVKGEAVLDFLMGKFKPTETTILKKVNKEIDKRLEQIIK
ncbi:aminoacyl-tRNA hydrolase [Patescibacteria group bacterium]